MTEKARVHFVGIGGIGMSGIASVLVELGYQVSGSDLSSNPITKRLEENGVRFFAGHAAGQVAGAEVVVVSSAIPADNPEVLEAHAQKIPVLQRAEMLAYLMRNRFGIAIAGTHGKTTTTSMVAAILETAGKDPTVLVGGEIHGLGRNARLGKSRFIVAEADESDASFLKLSPQVAVVTNIDADVNPSAGPFARLQFDYEKTMQAIQDAFFEFMKRIPQNGHAILCWDCPHTRRLAGELTSVVMTYGLTDGADLTATDVVLQGKESRFRVHQGGKVLGDIALLVPGEHNVLNALAAIGVALSLDIPFDIAKEALSGFLGVRRRFEILGEARNIMIVDDYAHNPNKIKATLAAAKAGWSRRRVAVFQPHRFTRSKFLRKEFAHAFGDADVVLVTEIYAAGEAPIAGVTGEALAAEIEAASPGKPVFFVRDEKEVLRKLDEVARAGDMVLLLGAGDIHRAGREFLKRNSS